MADITTFGERGVVQYNAGGEMSEHFTYSCAGLAVGSIIVLCGCALHILDRKTPSKAKSPITIESNQFRFRSTSAGLALAFLGLLIIWLTRFF